MARRKTTLEGKKDAAPETDGLVRLMSRKEFPIILRLKDGKRVKLTKNKPVVIHRDQLPDNLPAGVLAY